MKEDQEPPKDAVALSANRGLMTRASVLIRRGLDDHARQEKELPELDKKPLDSSAGLPTESDPWWELRDPVPDARNNLGMEFMLIPAGKFLMGSDAEEDEKPIHEVTISKPFHMGRYPVTQSEWQEIMGNDASKIIVGDDYPVHGVSWNDAQELIRKLNVLDARFEYRLPSEAEWEYACRAGTTGDFAGELDVMACYRGVDLQPVGSKSPNAFGLSDMHGSVLEWCEDHYHESYEGAPTDGTAWISGGVDAKINRVLRGGSFMSVVSLCRSAARSFGIRSASAGLRLVAIQK